MLWRADRDVLAGDDADQRFREAVADGELAILALSNAWLGQADLGEVVQRQNKATGLRVMPVSLRALTPHADVTGIGTTIYPQDLHGKPFADLRGDAARDVWVNGLVGQVHRLLARSGGTRAVSSPDMGLRDRRALSAECGDGYYRLHGRPGDMELDTEPDTRPSTQPPTLRALLLRAPAQHRIVNQRSGPRSEPHRAATAPDVIDRPAPSSTGVSNTAARLRPRGSTSPRSGPATLARSVPRRHQAAVMASS